MWTSFLVFGLGGGVLLVAAYFGGRFLERYEQRAAAASKSDGESRSHHFTFKEVVIYASHLCTLLIFIWVIVKLRNDPFAALAPASPPDREAILREELDKAKQHLEELNRITQHLPIGEPGKGPSSEQPKRLVFRRDD